MLVLRSLGRCAEVFKHCTEVLLHLSHYNHVVSKPIVSEVLGVDTLPLPVQNFEFLSVQQYIWRGTIALSDSLCNRIVRVPAL